MRIANAEKLQCNPNTTRDFLFIFAYANVIWIWGTADDIRPQKVSSHLTFK